MPLVPRHGAGVVRGRGHGGRAQRGLRRDQGRPGGAPGPGPAVHGRRPGDDGAGRLADERVPDARRAAVLRRHLLPRQPAPRDALLRAGPRGRAPGVDDAASGRGAVGRAARRGAGRGAVAGIRGRGLRAPCARDPGRGTGRRGRLVRPGPWWLGPGAEVPAADDDRVPPPASCGHRGRDGAGGRAAQPRGDGGGRDPRPPGWRLPPLRDRRRLAGPALRADALRQRATRSRVRARVGTDRWSGAARDDDRSARLRRPRAHDGRRRVRRQPGRRYRGRGGRHVRVGRGRGARRAGRFRGPVRGGVRGDGRRQLGGPHDPVACPRRRRAGGAVRARGRGGGLAAGGRAGSAAGAAVGSTAAGARRQGARRVERARDRRVRGCGAIAGRFR